MCSHNDLTEEKTTEVEIRCCQHTEGLPGEPAISYREDSFSGLILRLLCRQGNPSGQPFGPASEEEPPTTTGQVAETWLSESGSWPAEGWFPNDRSVLHTKQRHVLTAKTSACLKSQQPESTQCLASTTTLVRCFFILSLYKNKGLNFRGELFKKT